MYHALTALHCLNKVTPSLMGEVMLKVRESTLAEIQRVPVLHDGSVPSVPAAFCAGL